MAYASIHDIAASWDSYERSLVGLTTPAPAGLILYLAGPTDEGVRLIVVWDGETASERFRRDRLAPALTALGGPIRPVWTVRSLRPAHVVPGTHRPLPVPVPQPQEEHPC